MIALNLARIRTAHETFEQAYEPSAVGADEDDFKVITPVALAFDIAKSGAQFRLTGTVKTTLQLPCSRCLEPLTWPVDAAFDLRYQPRELNSGDGEREVDDEELTTAFYENDTIDLGQLMREQLYLSLPMKPLCGEECLGLCSQCGTNLNRDTCGCAREWDDPRFATLRSMTRKES
jgi:uncharacterized protein